MNKRTVALTTEQYKEIISTMKQGFTGCRPNERVTSALMLEANLGLRISDIIKLHLSESSGTVSGIGWRSRSRKRESSASSLCR